MLALPAPPTRPPLKLGPSIQVPCCPPSSRPIHHLNHASQQSKSHTRNLKHGPCRVWGAAHGQLPAARPPLPAGAVCSNQTFYCYPALCSRPQGMTSARRPLSQWGSSLGGGGGLHHSTGQKRAGTAPAPTCHARRLCQQMYRAATQPGAIPPTDAEPLRQRCSPVSCSAVVLMAPQDDKACRCRFHVSSALYFVSLMR